VPGEDIRRDIDLPAPGVPGKGAQEAGDRVGDARVPGGIGGAAAAELVLIGGLALAPGSLLRETYHLLLRAARSSTAASETAVGTFEPGTSAPRRSG
jgi:hypothetical protein